MTRTADTEIPDPEPLLIVDLCDRPVGAGLKPDIHKARQWHRQTYVIILDGSDNILLQRRSNRRQFDPGCWTTSVSGHVTSKDSYPTSATREVKEEIGIDAPELIYIGKVLAYSETDEQICGGPSAVFVGCMEIDPSQLVQQEAEVIDVDWFSIDDIEATIAGAMDMHHNGEVVQFSQDFQPVFELFLNLHRCGSS